MFFLLLTTNHFCSSVLPLLATTKKVKSCKQIDFKNVNAVAKLLQPDKLEKNSKKNDKNLALTNGLSRHYSLEKEKCLLSLFGTMKENAKLAPLTELVASAGNPDTKRPLLFELCSGFLNKQKINVLNSVLVDHVLTIKKGW